MAWRELIFIALFLYVISPTTCTEIRQCSPSSLNPPGDNRGPDGRCCIYSPGMARVSHVTRGILCSGFAVRQKVVVTVASCVYGRDKEVVVVEIKGPDSWDMWSNRVRDIKIHPNYKEGQLKYNVAVLFALEAPTTSVFTLHPYDITPRQMIRDITRIFVNEFEEIDRSFVYYGKEFYTTDDFSVCGEFVSNPDWYCVFRNGYNPTYDKVQVGSPVFFRDKYRNKKVIGIYTEADTCDGDAKGTLYQKIHPVVSWIKSVWYS